MNNDTIPKIVRTKLDTLDFSQSSLPQIIFTLMEGSSKHFTSGELATFVHEVAPDIPVQTIKGAISKMNVEGFFNHIPDPQFKNGLMYLLKSGKKCPEEGRPYAPRMSMRGKPKGSKKLQSIQQAVEGVKAQNLSPVQRKILDDALAGKVETQEQEKVVRTPSKAEIVERSKAAATHSLPAVQRTQGSDILEADMVEISIKILGVPVSLEKAFAIRNRLNLLFPDIPANKPE